MGRAIVDCPIACRGCDTNGKLDPVTADGLKQAGFQFVVRYVSLGTPNDGDLTPAEVAALLAAGLGVMVVQHVRFPGWSPTLLLGSQDGASAIRQAVTCGVPRGATLWVDLEGTAEGTTADHVSSYVAAWSDEATRGGYEAGAYVGAGLPADLTPDALWQLHVTRYWRSQSEVPAVHERGYQLLQLNPSCRVDAVFPGAALAVADLMVDVDIAQRDYRGSVPRMLVGV